MPEKQNFFQHEIGNDAAAEKDFPQVLKKILLNTSYKISDLEFEFDLHWNKLKPLLDKNAQYSIDQSNDGKEDTVKIIDNSGPKREKGEDLENLTTEEEADLKQIIALFYTNAKDPFRYNQVSIKKVEKLGLKSLVKKGLASNVVYYDQTNNKLSLTKWFRKYKVLNAR